MFGYDTPYIKSIERGIESGDEDKVFMNKYGVSKPMLSIWQGGDDPYKPVPLDYDSKRYIRVRLNNIIKTYDEDGVENQTTNSLQLSSCT